MKNTILFFAICLLFAACETPVNQTSSPVKAEDAEKVRDIFNEALTDSPVYEQLRHLCKNIGTRLSGSPGAAQAVEWGKQSLEQMDSGLCLFATDDGFHTGFGVRLRKLRFWKRMALKKT